MEITSEMYNDLVQRIELGDEINKILPMILDLYERVRQLESLLIKKEVVVNKEKPKSPTVYFSEIESGADWVGNQEPFVKEQLEKFYNYWTEPDQKGKQRWQKEKTFEFKRRFVRWMENQKDTGHQKKEIKDFNRMQSHEV